jgi:hypothetical protein
VHPSHGAGIFLLSYPPQSGYFCLQSEIKWHKIVDKWEEVVNLQKSYISPCRFIGT